MTATGSSVRGPLRIALIGAGEVCEHKHLRALPRVRGARVVALADTDPARLQHVGDRYGIAARFTNPFDCLDASVADIVGILTPPASHHALAIAALQSGRHVLVEKPLALSVGECDALVTAAAASRAVAMTGFHMRWHRLLQRARDIVVSGQLGRLESVRTIWNSPRPDRGTPPWKWQRVKGGGAIVELGVHLFDQWRFLTGSDIVDVHARARHDTRDDESAMITARLANGMLAEATVSERTSHEIEIEVAGDQGRLRVSCQRFDGLAVYARHETAGMLAPRGRSIIRTMRELPRGLARMRTLGDYGDSYRAQWQHLVDCVTNGVAPGCTIADGRAATQVALAAAASASSDRPWRVADAPPELSPARA